MKLHPVRVLVTVPILVVVAMAAGFASKVGNGFGWLVLVAGMLVAGGFLFHGTDAGFTPRRR